MAPHFRSKPSCFLVIQPFSMPSITQPHSQPNSLTSRHARSSWVLSQATPSLSAVTPIVQPAPDHPSYSGSSTILPLYAPCRMTDMWQWCMPHELHWCPRWSKPSRSLGASHCVMSASVTLGGELRMG